MFRRITISIVINPKALVHEEVGIYAEEFASIAAFRSLPRLEIGRLLFLRSSLLVECPRLLKVEFPLFLVISDDVLDVFNIFVTAEWDVFVESQYRAGKGSRIANIWASSSLFVERVQFKLVGFCLIKDGFFFF